MDSTVGAYLLRRSDPEYVHTNRTTNQQAAVIVETRRAFFLEHVIRTTMKTLGSDWNLHILHGAHNGDHLKERLRGWNVTFSQLVDANLTPAGYNALLTSKSFWGRFGEPRLLMFQLDTVLLRSPPDSVWQYAMVGAPCGTDTLNGGLSTRLKAHMIDVLCRAPHRPPGENEDVYFTRELRKLSPHMVPHLLDAARVFVESPGWLTAEPAGAHGTDKPYMPPAAWDKLLGIVR